VAAFIGAIVDRRSSIESDSLPWSTKSASRDVSEAHGAAPEKTTADELATSESPAPQEAAAQTGTATSFKCSSTESKSLPKSTESESGDVSDAHGDGHQKTAADELAVPDSPVPELAAADEPGTATSFTCNVLGWGEALLPSRIFVSKKSAI
jgi:hypothetical protein